MQTRVQTGRPGAAHCHQVFQAPRKVAPVSHSHTRLSRTIARGKRSVHHSRVTKPLMSKLAPMTTTMHTIDSSRQQCPPVRDLIASSLFWTEYIRIAAIGTAVLCRPTLTRFQSAAGGLMSLVACLLFLRSR